MDRPHRIKSVARACAFGALAALAALSPAPAEPLPADSSGVGKLVVAGGAVRASREEIWERILAERLPGRPIGIVSTASADPAAAGTPLADELNRDWGTGSAVFLPLGVEGVSPDDPELVERIRQCGGIFFSGGLQTRTTRRLLATDGRPTGALSAIGEVHLAGGVVAGSSAGAAIMSDPMIAGGSSAAAWQHGATPAGAEERGVEYRTGFGFHPGVVYCQHHLERGRFGRLLVATLSEAFGQSRGIGVSEDSAVVVDLARGTATAIGARGAVYLDSSGAVRGEDGEVSGVRLHHLGRGDAIDLATGDLVPASGKQEVPPSGETPSTTATPAVRLPDAFAPEAVRELIAALADAGGPADAQAGAGDHEFILRRTPTTRIWRVAQEEDDEAPAIPWTVSDLEVVVRVTRNESETRPAGGASHP